MALVDYFSGGADAVRPRAFTAGSDIVGSMTEGAAEAIVAAMAAWPSSAGSVTAVIESLTGAVQDLAPSDSAFPWRRQASCVQWYTEAPTPAATDWLVVAHSALGSNSVGGYVNYVESGTAANRYFAANVDRLASIHEHFDPDALMINSVS